VTGRAARRAAERLARREGGGAAVPEVSVAAGQEAKAEAELALVIDSVCLSAFRELFSLMPSSLSGNNSGKNVAKNNSL
jgi:hypothetical protein